MPTDQTSDELLDVGAVAARLGVSERFVRRLVLERRIAFHKIGRYVRFDPTEVDEWIARTRIEEAATW